MKTIDLHLERKAFEAWIAEGTPEPTANYDYITDSFNSKPTQKLWEGWQTRARYEPTDFISDEV